MRRAAILLIFALLASGCAGLDAAPRPSPAPSPAPSSSPPSGPEPSPPSGPEPSPPTEPATPPPAVPSPAPRLPAVPPPRVVVANGTLEEMQVNASTMYEVVFLLSATDRVRVNLVFHDLQTPAPYGWSGQVSLRGPDGRLVADSGTSMPESGAAFTLVLRDLALDPGAGPYEFLARVHTSHPTTLTGKAYVDDAAGPAS